MYSIRILRRLLCATFLVFPLVSNGSAIAKNGGYGNASPQDTSNVHLDAQSPDSSSGAGGGGRGSGSDIKCDAVPLATLHDPTIPNPGNLGGVTDFGQVIPPNMAGTWAYVECYHPDGSLASSAGVTFYPLGAPADPVQLMREAKNNLPLPPPAVQLSPPANLWQYVQMPTWAWMPAADWKPLTASASAGPVVVSVTATPVRLAFTYQISGAGTTATASCAGPGTPYSDHLATVKNPIHPILASSPDCGWTWHQSSVDTPDKKYAVAAHVVYHVVWTVQGATGGGAFELNGRESQFRVSVGEIQAVNIAPR